MIKTALSLLMLLVFSCAVVAQDYWVQCDSVKGPPRSVAGAFTANGQGYVLAGLESDGFVRRMYSYNVMQDDWDSEESIGGINGGGLSRGSASTFSVYNKGYICLGQGDNTNFLNDLWEFDPVTQVWTQKANFPGTARRGAVAFVINGIAYVGTGEDEDSLRSDFYKYDPVSNMWAGIARFGGTGRRYACGFAMGGQGYVGTGDDGIMRNDFWQYQVFQNVWIQKPNFPGTARVGATAWGIFPSAYIATGEDLNWNYCNDVWEFNYYTNQWIQRTPLPATGRKHAISFVIGNTAYLGTGYNGDLLDDFYAYSGIVGVEENESVNSSLLIYPAPASEKFNVRVNNNLKQDARLVILDIYGRDVTSSFSISLRESEFVVVPDGHVAGNFVCNVVATDGEMLGSASIIVVAE